MKNRATQSLLMAFMFIITMATTTMPLGRSFRAMNQAKTSEEPILIVKNDTSSSLGIMGSIGSLFGSFKKYLSFWWDCSTEAKVTHGILLLTAGKILKGVGSAAYDAHQEAVKGKPEEPKAT